MKTANRIIAICALALGLSSNAFAEEKKVSTVDPSSIYHRIGGQAAINAAVDLFYTKVLVDKRVNHFFEDVNMSRQNKRQKAFLGAALGGPVPYEGKTMRKAHALLISQRLISM
jgi:truncated hemoglobin YjbI